MVKLKIQRLDPVQDKAARTEEYDVPYSKGMRVITALQYIQQNHDGTLAFRWNCRAGECGSCAMEVNGKPVLACKTEIKPDAPTLSLAPLKVFPVVKDFVVDRSEVDRQLERLTPYLVKGSDKSASDSPVYDEDVQRTIEMRKCIDCLICHDSCHVIREGLNYTGPRNIVQAMAWDYHPKDKGGRALLLGREGIDYCNVSRCCTNNCPQGIKITQNAIIPVKERIQSENSVVGKAVRKLFQIGQ